MGAILAGLGKKERAQLTVLLKAGGGVITPKEAALALKVTQSQAAQLLARWNKKGWLSRVKRGVYIPVPLQSATSEIMADEPWIIAKSIFQPCYIGGWSAAEHWDFTEQIFNSVMVFTSKKVASREMDLNGAHFTVKTIKSERIFGLKSIWIQNQKVEISDPTRTIVDAFNDPTTVGGIRMAIDMLSRYMRSEHKNLELLSDYTTKMKNTAIFKRLGFVLSQNWPEEKKLIDKARRAIKSGYSQLDPAVPGKSLATLWGLWVPKGWKKGLSSK
jgi:predicted transcriptional regulator of viral defense system